MGPRTGNLFGMGGEPLLPRQLLPGRAATAARGHDTLGCTTATG